MDSLFEYANDWTKSAKHFYDRGDYKWAADFLPLDGTVLEIGCGTGYSPLAIIEHGNKVIGIDKNIVCIDRAICFLDSKPNLKDRYLFYKTDVFDNYYLQKIINDFDYDIVVIWNVGTAKEFESEHERHCAALKSFGYTSENIDKNYLMSYNEGMIFLVCQIAKCKNAIIQIVERIEHMPSDDEIIFYEELKNAICYRDIEYNYRKTKSLSLSGK